MCSAALCRRRPANGCPPSELACRGVESPGDGGVLIVAAALAAAGHLIVNLAGTLLDEDGRPKQRPSHGASLSRGHGSNPRTDVRCHSSLLLTSRVGRTRCREQSLE